MSDTPKRALGTWYAWYVVAVLTLANASAWIDRQIVVLMVTPIEKDLHITDTQMSLVSSGAFALFFAVLGLPIARLADRASRRNIIGTGVGLWSVFTALCATARSFGGLLALRIGVGVGEATLNAPGVSLLADYFPRERLSRAMSVYSLGIFLGSGAGYLIGGTVLATVSTQAAWHVPLFGELHPWQAAFLAVGLPGFLVALLFLTVREPARRNADQAGRYLPISQFVKYVRANARAYATHSFGFAIAATVNIGIAFWIPVFFERTYGWPAPRIGRIMGILTMTIGVVGVVSGGWIADWFVARGRLDGPMRVGIIGAVGVLISATIFPLAPTAPLAVVALAVLNIFAAFPFGAASAAAAEMAPTALRAQGAALYFFVLTLISGVLGPTLVALLNDHVFGAANVRYSLASFSAVGMVIAIILLTAGLSAYRRTLEFRESWDPSV
jgi:MFS family permease